MLHYHVQISNLKGQVSDLQNEINVRGGNQTITVLQNGTSLVDIYGNVSNSVVLIQGTLENDTGIQGSGFVYDYLGRFVMLTNYQRCPGHDRPKCHFLRWRWLRGCSSGDGPLR